MKQTSFIDPRESQSEYMKAIQHGYGFTRHGNCAHYLFSAEQVEPSIREKLPPAKFYIWSFVGCTMASAGKRAPVITPTDDAVNWTRDCDKVVL